MQAQKEKRGVIFKRAETYVKEYRDAEREKIRLSRLSKQDGTYYVPDEPKLVFVVRIKGSAPSLPFPTTTLLTSIPVLTRSPPNPAKSSNSSVSSKSTMASSSNSPKPPPKC